MVLCHDMRRKGRVLSRELLLSEDQLLHQALILLIILLMVEYHVQIVVRARLTTITNHSQLRTTLNPNQLEAVFSDVSVIVSKEAQVRLVVHH